MHTQPTNRAPKGVKRHDLIEATLDCIAEFGFQGAGVRQIAERANVTPGLIRHYFESKEHLVQESYRFLLSNMMDLASRVDGDPKTRLKQFIISTLHEPIADIRNFSLWAAFISQTRIDPELSAIHREGYLRFRHEVEMMLEAYLTMANVNYSPNKCRFLSIAINALVDGLWLEACLARDLFEPDELINTAISSIEKLIELPLD